MKLYMLAESDDLAEIELPITSAIEEWLSTQEGDTKPTFVNLRHEAHDDHKKQGERRWELGLELIVQSKAGLQEPLSFLYGVAKQNKCDFVIGILDGESKEDICYFGHEEGRPDRHEVAMYLGL